MESDVLALLGYADALLSGRIEVSGDAAPLAAFVARRGAEVLIDERCARRHGPLPGAGWRNVRWASKIAILMSEDDEAARALIYAWQQLSNLCHEHAYELTPTVDEVRNLCVSVLAIADAGSGVAGTPAAEGQAGMWMLPDGSGQSGGRSVANSSVTTIESSAKV